MSESFAADSSDSVAEGVTVVSQERGISAEAASEAARPTPPSRCPYSSRVIRPLEWPIRLETVASGTPATKLVESDVPTVRMPGVGAGGWGGIRQGW